MKFGKEHPHISVLLTLLISFFKLIFLQPGGFFFYFLFFIFFHEVQFQFTSTPPRLRTMLLLIFIFLSSFFCDQLSSVSRPLGSPES